MGSNFSDNENKKTLKMKLFVAAFATASALTEVSAADRQWNALQDRRAAFGAKLREMDFGDRFADRFDEYVQKGVNKIALNRIGVEGCQNVWGIEFDEEDDFNPETATICEYARKIGRSFFDTPRSFSALMTTSEKDSPLKNESREDS